MVFFPRVKQCSTVKELSCRKTVINETLKLGEFNIEFNIEFNLQTVLFRPLRSHLCSSEWFENWDMSTAQRAINTSHTDKHSHIFSEYQSAQTQKSEQCIMRSGIKSKRQQIIWAFSNQRVLNITEQLPEYQSEMERNKLNLQTDSPVSTFEVSSVQLRVV